jgi:hypothetical protein
MLPRNKLPLPMQRKRADKLFDLEDILILFVLDKKMKIGYKRKNA